jgi:hypothetical protein
MGARALAVTVKVFLVTRKRLFSTLLITGCAVTDMPDDPVPVRSDTALLLEVFALRA